MEKNKNLLDLPIRLEDRDAACETEEIGSAYINELKLVSSAEDLTKFVERWRNIFLLQRGPEDTDPLSEEEGAIVTGKFDAAAVAALLPRKGENDLDFTDTNVKIMAMIAAPITLLMAVLFAKHYGVGTDLGLVRLYLDPFPELENEMRG